jgi:hypothetical protein
MWKIPIIVAVLSVSAAEPPIDSPRIQSHEQSTSFDGCWNLVIKTPLLHPNQRGRFFFTA